MSMNTPRRPAPSIWDSLSMTHILIIGSLLLTAVIIGGFLLVNAGSPEMYSTNIGGVERYEDMPPGEHRSGIIEYDLIPPAGGPHNAVWQNCGVYDEPVASEHAVHSLEHGTVWITYQPDLDPEQVEQLADLTRGSTHRLLSPFPGIDSPIVLSAWGVQLKVDSADDERILDFISTYEQGPTTPERGASCSGGQSLTAAQLGR